MVKTDRFEAAVLRQPEQSEDIYHFRSSDDKRTFKLPLIEVLQALADEGWRASAAREECFVLYRRKPAQ